MHRYAIYFYVTTKNLQHGMVESKIMDSIAAIEKSAINIEEIGVSRIPAKAGAYIRLGGGRRLVVSR